MKKILITIAFFFLKLAFWLRYKVKVKGLENLNPETLNKSGGILFLPNHPSYNDPVLVILAIINKFHVRPIVIEYIYYTFINHWFLKLIDAIPIPDFTNASNSLKRKKGEEVVTQIIHDLKNGKNFLLYPSGMVKKTSQEIVTGTSGTHRIISSTPEANIVLVRTIGLWGSKFSYAQTGSAPSLIPTYWWGIKTVLKNGIFFSPRREVTIEFVPAGAEFPYQASRGDMNRYLENWYNRPFGLKGEPLKLVRNSIWSKSLPTITQKKIIEEEFSIQDISPAIQKKVQDKIAEISKREPNQIKPEMMLAADIGLDSLDAAELVSFLNEEFDISEIPVSEFTTVKKIMGIAARKISFKPEEKDEVQDMTLWHKARPKQRALLTTGETIPEVFFNACNEMGNQTACADLKAGILSYSKVKMRVILLATYIQKLPGNYIGILLPSSVASSLLIFACQVAGKIPLPINWTIGSWHLETVVSMSKVQHVISSWAFLDQLDNVELNGLDDKILTLEEMRYDFSIGDKVLAWLRSKYSTKTLLKLFNIETLTGKDIAGLLFTSGTESIPKGVPLTHENILSNQRGATSLLAIFTDDICLSILPPFHAFGFTVCSILPFLNKVRVAFSPKPTDGKALARDINKWKGTYMCGVPSFLKGMFKTGQKEQFTSLRLCITGAEKAPPDLFILAKEKAPQAVVLEGYGITECSPILTINISGDVKFGVGEPLPGIEIIIVDLDTHQLLPEGSRGLILTRGLSIFNRYLNLNAASPFINVDGKTWYNTGDLGYFVDKKNLIIAGRLKRFIKIGGEMISLGALEEALTQKVIQDKKLGDIEGPLLAICAKENSRNKPAIILITKYAISLGEANKALREFGFSRLAKISGVEVLNEIPILGSGKINYRELESNIL